MRDPLHQAGVPTGLLPQEKEKTKDKIVPRVEQARKLTLRKGVGGGGRILSTWIKIYSNFKVPKPPTNL